MPKQTKRLLEFAEFTLDCREGLLYSGDQLVPLAPKAAQTLLALVERHGELVTKDELMKAVWPDTFVEESSLSFNLHVLRKTLNSDGSERFIETLPRRGYRFIADVRERIEQPGESIQPVPAAPAPTPAWHSRRWALASAGLIAVMAAGIALLWTQRMTPQPALVQLTQHQGSNRQPDASPDGRHVVFVSNRDGGKDQIYVMEIDGRNPRNLTRATGIANDSPAWSPDGRRIAFQSNRRGVMEIFVMETDGSNPAPIARGVRPAWSPDGKMLAYSYGENRHPEVYIVAADRSLAPRQVTFDQNFCSDPVWSPDGTRLAFTSRGAAGLEVHSMRLDGSDRTVLASGPGDNRLPVWFRDGRIAFNSNRNVREAIFVMESDGSLQHRITQAQFDDAEASWSADGRSVFFESERDGDPQILRLRLPDSRDGAIALTSTLANNLHPVWSPDGKWIAFESNRDGQPQLFLMDPDGNHTRNMTRGPASNRHPTWSPDGAKIALVGEHEGKRAIYTIRGDGSGLRQVTEGDDDQNPAWSPDGRTICFDRGGSIRVAPEEGGPSRAVIGGVECVWQTDGKRMLFAEMRQGVREIYSVNPDGSGILNVTRNGHGNGTPSFSRDGSRIAFNSDRDGFGFGIFVMNSDGSLQRRITGPRVFDTQPSWSPDGRWILFARDLDGRWQIFKTAAP